jgi:hypothetical protein
MDSNCGGLDVNNDGVVDQNDVASVILSGTTLLGEGTPVPCGVIMTNSCSLFFKLTNIYQAISATDFSCGSSRAAPLTAAVDVSIDNIYLVNDWGLSKAAKRSDDKLEDMQKRLQVLEQLVAEQAMMIERLNSV